MIVKTIKHQLKYCIHSEQQESKTSANSYLRNENHVRFISYRYIDQPLQKDSVYCQFHSNDVDGQSTLSLVEMVIKKSNDHELVYSNPSLMNKSFIESEVNLLGAGNAQEIEVIDSYGNMFLSYPDTKRKTINIDRTHQFYSSKISRVVSKVVL